MPVVLLTPWALALAPVLAAAGALVAFVLRRRRLRAERLGFTVSRRPAAASVCAATVVAFAVVAAAQPAVSATAVRMTRADAQVWITVDTSNSMLARSAKNGRTRLAQAKAFTAALRGRLAQLPVGIAAMTDRVLPLLPPTSDQAMFSTVIRHTLKADTPPPTSDFTGLVATSFSLLGQVPRQDFFAHASRRVMVVVTDEETQPFNAVGVAAAFQAQHEKLIMVRAGTSHDHIWLSGSQDSYYQPLKTTPPAVARLARLEHEPLFTTRDSAAVARAVEAAVGTGPMRADGRRPVYRSLAPFVLLASLPLLVFVLTVYLAGLIPAGTRERVS